MDTLVNLLHNTGGEDKESDDEDEAGTAEHTSKDVDLET